MTYRTTYNSPLGAITLSSDGTFLTGLWFENHKSSHSSIDEDVTWTETLPIFRQTIKWLDIYFAGNEPEFTPPLKVEGSEFFKTVSEIMRQIPYSETTTYGAIAAEAAKRLDRKRMSAQAVGGAVGRNPISIIIPCHRVIGADGNLTGYAEGLHKKISLLKIEKTDMSKMFMPKNKYPGNKTSPFVRR